MPEFVRALDIMPYRIPGLQVMEDHLSYNLTGFVTDASMKYVYYGVPIEAHFTPTKVCLTLLGTDAQLRSVFKPQHWRTTRYYKYSGDFTPETFHQGRYLITLWEHKKIFLDLMLQELGERLHKIAPHVNLNAEHPNLELDRVLSHNATLSIATRLFKMGYGYNYKDKIFYCRINFLDGNGTLNLDSQETWDTISLEVANLMRRHI